MGNLIITLASGAKLEFTVADEVLADIRSDK